ncbi:MAG: alpha-2-macroglobulin family protein [Nostocales cyanobacterium]|nr:MAG: alpha-2-macroglobulin family protein [Nostocales cyanobacterium]TAF19150.1 MAG: alpha-2-macroglobulin family protein [Nostocales cyanobacterium]
MMINKLVRFLLVITLILSIAGCVTISPGKEKLPTVGELTPPKLPEWIEEVSPLGDADTLSQVRIRFKSPLIPVESLDSPKQDILLNKFAIWPPLPGRFRFLTPRMVGFQADQGLPVATRLQVTLKAGLQDLENHSLAQDLSWTLQTPGIKLTNLPGVNLVEKADLQPVDIQPQLQFTANTELDINSVKKHLQLVANNQSPLQNFQVELVKDEEVEGLEDQNNLDPLANFDPSVKNWVYNIIPGQSLEKATVYRLVFSPGILPAYGNLPSNQEFSSKLATYAPLKFEGIKNYGQPDAGGTYGRFIKGSPQLEFNNVLSIDSAKSSIKIDPLPEDMDRVLQIYDQDRFININPYALKPATNYTITIDRNLQDQFGQSLEKTVKVEYNTGDLAGDIQVPGDLNIFPKHQDLQLNFTAVNLPESEYKAAYRVVKPTDLVYTNNANDLLIKSDKWQTFKVAEQKKNQPVNIAVKIKERLNNDQGMLAYGVQAKTNKYLENNQSYWREPTTYGMIQLTNLGVFSQWFPESGLVRVHHLDDGSPVQDANVEIYQSKLYEKNNSASQPVPCLVGKTDVRGTLELTNNELQKCYSGDEKLPKLLVIVRENTDWAFTRTQEYSGSYGYGVYTDWDDGKPKSRGVIFSDRQLYQPGEKAVFTGFADFLERGEIIQDQNANYQLSLENPNGQKTDLGTKTTNKFGTFSLELPINNINNNQPLGYYRIIAKGENGKEINGNFQVAEFKPPNFKVDLQLNKEFALVGDLVNVNVSSNYLFGSPVETGKARYFVTRQQTNFIPPGWEGFNFGKQWFWPEESPNITNDVLQTQAELDVNGKGSQSITVTKDLPYPMTYRVDVEVADVSNLSVANSQTFTALPTPRLIGLKSNFVGNAGENFPVEFIVTDAKGKPLENTRIKLELQEIKYSSVTQVIEGSRTPKNQVEYKTVAKAEVTSANIPKTLIFQPQKSGTYRIRANFTNSFNDVTATDLQIWVTGENQVFWGGEEKDKLTVKLDKKSYKVGETATALIQSPYPEGELYFAVIKDKPIYQQITKVTGNAPQIQFTVTPEMLPNAAVQTVLVRQGKPLQEIKTSELTSLDNLAKIGFTDFQVNLSDKYLKVQITPNEKTLEPGKEQTLKLTLTDNQNNPTSGQFTVMVVNEAILQLSGYRPPNLVNTVYAEQPILTRFSDNRPDVKVTPVTASLPKGWGYGGGLSNALANTRIRENFQPLAYYNGGVISDENGQANITFKLPDNLTTWRVMVVATDGNLRFGNGEETFITTKPLITNAIIPQFARLGDRIFAGLTITNNTKNTGDVEINGVVSGALTFAENNPKTQIFRTKAESKTQAYRFPMVAETPGESKITFATRLNNFSDAFTVPLEIQPLGITEQVVETGIISPLNKGGERGDKIKIPLNIDKTNINPEIGGLEIELASTLIPEITAPANQVFTDNKDNNLPFAEPAASQLLIAANLQKLSEKFSQTFTEFTPQQQAKLAILQLQKLQLLDGGFAAYPGQEKSDPWVSAYAAESLVTANQIYPNLVNNQTLSNLKTYLQKVLANPKQYDFCKSKLCQSQLRLDTLIALDQLGDQRNSFLTDIYQQKDKFDLVTKIKLARYSYQFPEWQNESQIIRLQLQKNIYETGRNAVVNLPKSWTWMGSPSTVQSQALRLFITQKTPPEIIDKLLQSLLNLRKEGTWKTTYDNAQALTALVEYSQLQPTPPNFTATVKLAGKKLANAKFNGYENVRSNVNIDMTKLPNGKHDLIFQKSGNGNLHYLAAYKYRLQGTQPGRFNGIRVTKEISKINAKETIQKIGMYAIDKPLTLLSGEVFDIGVEIIADHPIDHIIIKDHLPAGFEAIDQNFQTATSALTAKTDSWQIGYQTIYKDKIIAYGNHLEPGIYNLHYLVRSVTPGSYLWPGAEAYLQYAPEEFGRSADSTLILEPSK